jgi:hypothetical protein
MTSQSRGIRRAAEIEHMENGYVLTEVPEKGGEDEFSVRPKIPTKKFPCFTETFIYAGVLRDFDSDLLCLVLLLCRQAEDIQ